MDIFLTCRIPDDMLKKWGGLVLFRLIRVVGFLLCPGH